MSKVLKQRFEPIGRNTALFVAPASLSQIASNSGCWRSTIMLQLSREVWKLDLHEYRRSQTYLSGSIHIIYHIIYIMHISYIYSVYVYDQNTKERSVTFRVKNLGAMSWESQRTKSLGLTSVRSPGSWAVAEILSSRRVPQTYSTTKRDGCITWDLCVKPDLVNTSHSSLLALTSKALLYRVKLVKLWRALAMHWFRSRETAVGWLLRAGLMVSQIPATESPSIRLLQGCLGLLLSLQYVRKQTLNLVWQCR